MNVNSAQAFSGLELVALAILVACACPLQAEPLPAMAEAAASASPAAESALLGSSELVRRVLSHNRTVLSKRHEQGIAATGVDRAQAAFQPLLNLSGSRGQNRQKNTHEEALVRNNLGIYERTGNDYSVGLSQLFATGAKAEAKVTLASFLTSSNLLDTTRPDGVLDHRSAVSLSLTQPLARDAGPEVTQAKLTLARLDGEAAERSSRDTETSVAAEALVAYYDLLFSHQQLLAAQERLGLGGRLLEEANGLHRQGRIAAADVWEVENALARYQSAQAEARQGWRERLNRLRSQLMIPAGESPELIRVDEPLPKVEVQGPTHGESLGVALERRADFQWRKLQVEREGVQLAYAENQGLPRIDLLASYGINGLEYHAKPAFAVGRMNDYPNWSIGVQVQVPLGENLQAGADIAAAALRRQDALLAVKAAEVQISNEIDTSLGMRASAAQRWQIAQQVEERERQRLELERRKFSAGRSDTREVLQRIERAINAGLAAKEQQLAFAKADMLLLAAQGILLDGFQQTESGGR